MCIHLSNTNIWGKQAYVWEIHDFVNILYKANKYLVFAYQIQNEVGRFPLLNFMLHWSLALEIHGHLIFVLFFFITYLLFSMYLYWLFNIGFEFIIDNFNEFSLISLFITMNLYVIGIDFVFIIFYLVALVELFYNLFCRIIMEQWKVDIVSLPLKFATI